ncbi:MAG: alpha/beta hydrolase [Oscillospiraceae bacterium]
MRRRMLAVILLLSAIACTAAVLTACRNQIDGNPEVQDPGSASETAEGSLKKISYRISYDGNIYDKEASVYVPASYDGFEPMNILYLMHGSQGSGEQLADVMKPLLDAWIEEGKTQPMLVVFPTYYPDSSFVSVNYSQDYPLNHFFAVTEITELMKAVEGSFHTYAESMDEAGFSESRMHRAFGGYSMGGVTTWDILASHADCFAYFMPMAGDCWLDRIYDEPVDQLLVQGLEGGGYSSEDFMIIAMVGGNDGTKESMQPQVYALRENHSDLITDENLIYWENEGGSHSLESFELEMEHGLGYLWN